ncbi:MAG: RCC1 domain-containing protein [Myxococcota bacterium]
MFVSVDVGMVGNGCALRSDGAARCWGDEDWMGQGPGENADLVQLSSDYVNTCGVGRDGRVKCWCGPVQGNPPCGSELTGEFLQVEVASDAACARDLGGVIRCFDGYQGYTPALMRDIPVDPMIDLSISENLGCALRLDGSPTCWGATWMFSPTGEPDGDFGLGEAPPLDLTYTDIAVGDRFGCALAVDGEVHCWGTDPWLQDFPSAPPGPFTQIAADYMEACGLHPDGRVECWGTTDNLTPPPPVVQTEAPDEPLTSVALGDHAACGVTLDGRLRCWGKDPDGRFADLPEP